MFDFIQYTIPRVVQDAKNDIKYAYQRVVRGFDDSFVWSISTAHSELMVKVLTKFRKDHWGHPSALTEKKWNVIIDKMILGFNASLALEDVYGLDDKERKIAIKKYTKQLKEGSALFIEHYNDLWD